MRDFLIVFKTLFRNANAMTEGNDGKKKLSSGVKAMLSFLPLILMISVMVAFLAVNLNDLQEFSLLVIAIVGAAQILVLFLSMFSIVSTLYGSTDTPFLNSLPLRPTSVFFAKFAMTYVNAIELSTTIILPSVLIGAIAFNISSHTMFYGFYPLLIVILLVAPVLPLFVVAVFSMPVVWIGSYFKGKPTLKSVFVILFYMVLMAAYMVLVYYMNTRGFGQEGDVVVSSSTLASLATFAKVFYPDKVLVEYCLGINAGKNFGISAAITVGMIALMLVLSSLFYRRINSKKIEGTQSAETKNSTLKQNSAVVAIMKRDFTSIMRNSSLAMNSFANLLMAPLFIVVMYFITDFKSGADEGMSAFMSEMMGIGFVVMYSMIFLAGANMLANMAYTREGKSFFASKTLPIKPTDSIKAKLLLAILAPSVILVPIMLIALLLYKIDIVSTLFIGIDTLMMIVGICCMSILFDMKKGNQHWEQVSQIKNSSSNTYQLISAFAAIIPSIVLFVLGIVLAAFSEALDEVAVKAIYWSVATLFSAVIMTVGFCMYKKLGTEWYELIGENKPKIKASRRGFDSRRLMK